MSFTFRNCERGAPLVPKNVQAYASVRVDVWVIDSGGEVDFWGLEWIIRREMDG